MRDNSITSSVPLNRPRPWYRRFTCTITYIISIIAINNVFVYAPFVIVGGSLVSTGDLVVGAVYVLRDFVQREIKHYVFLAMLVGCFLSYFLADKQIALASVSAFFVGETIDWAIFTFTKKPLSQRLLSSSCVSAPIDSAVFLYISDMLNPIGLSALTLGKFIGILIIWFSWRIRKA